MLEDRQRVMCQILTDENHRTKNSRETRRSQVEEQKTLHEEDGTVTSVLMTREVEVGQCLNLQLRHLHIGQKGFPAKNIRGDGDDINTGTNDGGLENG